MATADSFYDQIGSILGRSAPALMEAQNGVRQLARSAQWFSLPGGNSLFDKGDCPDTIYFVVSGLLGACVDTPRGTESVIRRISPGETIGEMGCITGQPRSATVRALRSSQLMAIPWSDFEAIAKTDPTLLLSICRTVIKRLHDAEGPNPAPQPRTFAVTSDDGAIDLLSFAHRFAAALTGDTFVATRQIAQHLTADELFGLETQYKFVVYVSDMNSPSWSHLCERQADAVIVVASGDADPALVRESAGVANPHIPRVLALKWPSRIRAARTADWLRATRASRHFHVIAERDVHRMARLLTGTGFGLVLSGGGARGLAHLGVLRALRERSVAVDVIMGTSIGALVGAGAALEWQDEEFLSKVDQFCHFSPIRELTFPRTSLLAGRNVRKLIQQWFGDLQIEDTPTPYSCVSADLNSGELSIHQSGSLQTWTLASAAIPGIFPPVIVDGVVHVDGGVLNNMPTDLIREQGAGFVLGVDVGEGAFPAATDASKSVWRERTQVNILELLARVGSIGDEARAFSRRKACDVLITPDLQRIGLLNFRAYEQSIRAGYEAAQSAMEQIVSARSQLAFAPALVL